MKHRAAVVGLGRIGSASESDAVRRGERDAMPRTHVGALLRDPRFDLVAVADPDPAARRQFVDHWGDRIPVYEAAEQLFQAQPVDLAVVATSTGTHMSMCSSAMDAKARVIFCEKPFGTDLAQARAVVARAAEEGRAIFVNYHRRWDSKMQRLANELRVLGTPRFVDVVYRKGLYNYGSHIVDLLLWYFGPIVRVRADPDQATRERAGDPSLSAMLYTASGMEMRLTGLDGVDYDLFDVDIYTTRAKVRVEAGGYVIRRFDRVDDVYFPGYAHVVERPSGFEVAPVSGLTKAYADIAATLSGQPQTAGAHGSQALDVLAVLDGIWRSALAGGTTVTV